MNARRKMMCLMFAAALLAGCSGSELTGVDAERAVLTRQERIRAEEEQQQGVNKCAIYRNELCQLQ